MYIGKFTIYTHTDTVLRRWPDWPVDSLVTVRRAQWQRELEVASNGVDLTK